MLGHSFNVLATLSMFQRIKDLGQHKNSLALQASRMSQNHTLTGDARDGGPSLKLIKSDNFIYFWYPSKRTRTRTHGHET